jgi:hypothetical protein
MEGAYRQFDAPGGEKIELPNVFEEQHPHRSADLVLPKPMLDYPLAGKGGIYRTRLTQPCDERASFTRGTLRHNCHSTVIWLLR